jgi:hypothetical protein
LIHLCIKRIQVSYIYYFNKRYGRSGYLFQDRFKSEADEAELTHVNLHLIDGGFFIGDKNQSMERKGNK